MLQDVQDRLIKNWSRDVETKKKDDATNDDANQDDATKDNATEGDGAKDDASNNDKGKDDESASKVDVIEEDPSPLLPWKRILDDTMIYL